MKALALLIALTLSTQLFSQAGYWLNEGQNGAAVGLQIASINRFTGIGVDASYAINGTFDLGLGLSHGSWDWDFKDLSLTGINPFIVGHILKQEEDYLPMSISLFAGYNYGFVSSDILDAFGYELKQGTVYGGVNFNSIFEASRHVDIMPFAAIQYGSTKVTLKDVDFGSKVSESDGQVSFTLGVSVNLKLRNGNILAIFPSLNFVEGETGFTMNFKYILPTG